MTNLDYTIRLDVLSEGYDGYTQWFQPRAAPTTIRQLVDGAKTHGI
ncbi:MAG: hypothetical protein KKG09_10365 [Verrucomicrobia bacterium]|nr:hypothetical protein [Verrucomicrobiota bacterium]MCG2681834.1 hypothetical protein [Kiritimatiellia bacterium]MBU4247716.1 hypothetical protein [Verrucomicrobiota bacterium]MBU4291633.1 hypothetical protein [Verrucomicrobiota bacterium]MBU4429550.1 hypothetical protein [Verrucomicrobiota bacterium]